MAIAEIKTAVSVKAGDTVRILLQDGTPTVIGVVGGGDRMQAQIDDAERIANATGQHVWEDDSGVHITQVPREEYESDQSGASALLNSNGLLIGSERTKMAIDSDSMGVQDADGEMFLHAGLLNDEYGTFTTTGAITGAGAKSVALPFLNASINHVEKTSASGAVTELVAGSGYTYDGVSITLKAALTAGESVSVTYSVDWPVPSLTVGYRPKNEDGTPYTVGAYSVVLGQGVAAGYCSIAEGQMTASVDASGNAVEAFPYALGNGSHAEGIGTRAGGDGSHAGGYLSQANGQNAFAHGSGAFASGNHSAAFGWGTYAPARSSFACGEYNVGNADSIFEVGNGEVVNGAPKYSTAFAIGRDGSPTLKQNAAWSGSISHAMTVWGVSTAQSLGYRTPAKVIISGGSRETDPSGILEAADGGIKVNRTGMVLVSGKVRFTGVNAGDLAYTNIRRNTTAVTGSQGETYAATGGNGDVITTPFMVEITSPGQVISLYASNYTADRGSVSTSSGTYLTVQYLG